MMKIEKTTTKKHGTKITLTITGRESTALKSRNHFSDSGSALRLANKVNRYNDLFPSKQYR